MAEKSKEELLREYQKLYDDGLITKEEFEAKRKEILEVNQTTTIKLTPKAKNILLVGLCVFAVSAAGLAIYNTVFYLTNKTKNTSRKLEKDEMTFASYPQDVVEYDSSLHKTLLKVVGETPEREEEISTISIPGITTSTSSSSSSKDPVDMAKGWTSYKFYDSGKQKDYYWYKDFEYKSTKYRAIYTTLYRPESVLNEAKKSVDKYNNLYYSNLVYFFKYQPVIWRKLALNDGYYYLMSSKIIDYMEYEPREYDMSNPDGNKINNYKDSKIRNWLNVDFYKTTFSDKDVERLKKMDVDNSLESTLDSENKYVCENTQDYVSLLSKKEVMTAEYNLTSAKRRTLEITDYAEAMIHSKGRSQFWLRSPSSTTITFATVVNQNELNSDASNETQTDIFGYQKTTYSYYGVVPTISVKK